MIRLIDGPAAGAALSLLRAPVFLRAVVKMGISLPAPSDWDALDLLDDEAHPRERIVVYYRVTTPTVTFVDYRSGPKGGRRAGARLVSADYRVMPDQPADDVVRFNDAWHTWCEGRAQAIGVPA